MAAVTFPITLVYSVFRRTNKLSQNVVEINNRKRLLKHIPITRKLIRYYGTCGSCWKCNAATLGMFCEQCKSLQKPNKNLNYFKLFDVDPSFDLEINHLAKKFRQLQSVLHPDKFASRSQDEQIISDEYSSFINKAFTTLQKPLTRGLYLLELQGIYMEEGNVQSDPEFLMDLMERNEEVDQAKSESEIRTISEKNKRELEILVRDASNAFSSGDLCGAKAALVKIKYFSSIEEKIKAQKIKTGFVD